LHSRSNTVTIRIDDLLFTEPLIQICQLVTG
jgi:hypothetical protein